MTHDPGTQVPATILPPPPAEEGPSAGDAPLPQTPPAAHRLAAIKQASLRGASLERTDARVLARASQMRHPLLIEVLS